MLQSARSHLYTLGNLHCWGGQMPNQTVALWEDLKKLTRSVVEEMNRDAELSSRTGGLDFRFADVHSVVVTKLSSPQMFLSVRLNGEVLEVYSRSEEHTSELQSHSFISYAVFCLKKKK